MLEDSNLKIPTYQDMSISYYIIFIIGNNN